MKILYLNNYYFLRGGSEKVLFDEMTMMEMAGHDVAVFSRNHELNAAAKYSEYFPPRMETERLRVSKDIVRVVLNLVYSMEARYGIRKVVGRFSPNVAHAHNIYGRLSVSVLDALNRDGVPTVMTLHDYKVICPNYRLISREGICEECKGGRYYRAVVNRCQKESIAASAIYAFESYLTGKLRKYENSLKYLISPSEFLRRKLIDFGWDKSKVRYIPNFVHLSEFTPNYNPGEYLLYLGRLSGEKGILTLINAFSRMRQNSIKLIIVGDGPLRDTIENKSRGNKRIEIKGHLRGEALSNAIRKARAVIVPSEWYENAPISILEALAYGKPVVGAAIGGIPEMVEDGVNGYLFTSRSEFELQHALEKIIALSDSHIEDMARAAREKVERNYSAARHYQMLLEIYQEIAKGR